MRIGEQCAERLCAPAQSLIGRVLFGEVFGFQVGGKRAMKALDVGGGRSERSGVTASQTRGAAEGGTASIGDPYPRRRCCFASRSIRLDRRIADGACGWRASSP